jgi:hypothetical protein
MTGGSRRGWWLGAAAIGFIVIVAWWGARTSVNYHSVLRCCVDDPGTGGGLGVYLWARQLKLPVRALRDPLWEAVQSSESQQGNCFLTAGDGSWSPWDEALSSEQWGPIRGWVARGNTLIVVTTDPARIPKVIADDLFQSIPVDKRPFRSASPNAKGSEPFGSAVAADPTISSIVLPGLPQADTRAQQSLAVRADGPRWQHTPEAWQTAGDPRGTVWHRAPLGTGAVYILLDDFAWTNSGFDKDGNAAALASLLARELRGGEFGFDEYRHGHGRVESFASYLLSFPGAEAFCWIAAVLAGAYVLGRNVGFGRPEPIRLVERRSAREYVDAVAYLNQRARAAPLAVDSIVRRLRFVSSQRARLTPELEQTIAEAEKFAASVERPANPSSPCALARKLISLRKQCYGT